MRRILKISIGINTQTIYKNYSYSANLPIRGSSKVAVFEKKLSFLSQNDVIK